MQIKYIKQTPELAEAIIFFDDKERKEFESIDIQKIVGEHVEKEA